MSDAQNEDKHYGASFSLPPSISNTINNFTVLAANANRSIVLKACVLAFTQLDDKQKVKFIELVKAEASEEKHRITTFSITSHYSNIINDSTTLAPNTNRSIILKASVKAFDALAKRKQQEYLAEVIG